MIARVLELNEHETIMLTALASEQASQSYAKADKVGGEAFTEAMEDYAVACSILMKLGDFFGEK